MPKVMERSRAEIIAYFENITTLILGVVLFAFPLVFSTITSDAFGIPKQILLGVGVLLTVIIIGVRMVLEGKLKMRTTPFDLPILIFTVVAFVSALLSLNRYDSLISFIPLLFAVLLFFVLVNTAKTQNQILFLVAALVAGAAISGLITTASFFKLGLLPIPAAKTPGFNLFGSLLDQALYLALVLPMAGYISYPILAKTLTKKNVSLSESLQNSAVSKAFGFGIGFVLIALSLAVTVYMLVTTQKPLILPFETGFQTAFGFAQDTGRTFKTFLFGSGIGTYMTDFTRFKLPSYNSNQTLWSFTFFRSSSYLLELIATLGFLGVLSYLFIIFRVIRERVFFLPIVLILIASFILPFSFVTVTLLFVILALFASLRAAQNTRSYNDLEFYFVALKNGLLQVREEGERAHTNDKQYAKVLPILFLVIMLVAAGFLAYLSGRYVASDVMFQKSLNAAAQNNGRLTYDLQTQSIQTFPYRDAYYRIFSQTNLALANSVAAAQPRNSSPSAQVQQSILTLTQQSITAARQAVTISPLTSLNWDNLASIYRSLIGFGQNADQFAVLSSQQATALDPNNPQEYINLGGIYYQLSQWDNAIREFELAVRVKPDFSNAYYNLGHAYESKGDLQNALQAYIAVQQLVSATQDKDSLKKITAEIDALQKKIGSQQANPNQQAQAQTPAVQQQGASTQPPIGLSQPQASLPEQNPPVKLPNPPASPSAQKAQ